MKCDAGDFAHEFAHGTIACLVCFCACLCEQGVFEWHQRGFLHRDIKPDNVRVTAKGDIVIIDANIAKAISKCTPGKVSWKHEAAGTPGCMDPLVENGVYDWSPAAEVWSVGFMLESVCSPERHCHCLSAPVWLASLSLCGSRHLECASCPTVGEWCELRCDHVQVVEQSV